MTEKHLVPVFNEELDKVFKEIEKNCDLVINFFENIEPVTTSIDWRISLLTYALENAMFAYKGLHIMPTSAKAPLLKSIKILSGEINKDLKKLKF